MITGLLNGGTDVVKRLPRFQLDDDARLSCERKPLFQDVPFAHAFAAGFRRSRRSSQRFTAYPLAAKPTFFWTFRRVLLAR